MNDMALLAGKDPARVYCLANPNDFYCGVREMSRLGWVTETNRKDGPRVIGGDTAKDGDLVTLFGDVLMSRSLEAHRADQERSWSVADARSKAIGQRGGVDGVVGPTGRPAYFVESPEETIERGRAL